VDAPSPDPAAELALAGETDDAPPDPTTGAPADTDPPGSSTDNTEPDATDPPAEPDEPAESADEPEPRLPSDEADAGDRGPTEGEDTDSPLPGAGEDVTSAEIPSGQDGQDTTDDDATPTPTADSQDTDEDATPTQVADVQDEFAVDEWVPPSSPTTKSPVPGLAGQHHAPVPHDAPVLVDEPRPKRPKPTFGPMPGEDATEPTATRLTRRLLGASFALTQLTRHQRVMGWVWPLAVMVFGGVLRFWRLDQPHELVFDETYYVKDGYSMIARGYEADWGNEPNAQFEAGDTSMLATDQSTRVVHPPLGKWLIGAGIRLGGGVGNSWSWRLAVAIAGTLAILMVARIGRRLFASTALGTLAGLFMAVDGMGIVMSRTGLLDPLLMVFVLGAFGLLVVDRDQARQRLARRVAAVVDSGATMPVLGPWLGVRWWRLGSAVLLGLACGVKWSGIYFLAVFGLMSVLWDLTARYRVGIRLWFEGTLTLDALFAGVAMVTITAVTYVATWTSWFLSKHADYRTWADQHPGEGQMWMPDSLRSWWAWHVDSWNFHNTLYSEHPYSSAPAGWIIQLRPTSFYYSSDVSGLEGADAQAACGADACSQAITSLGNPLVWWLGAAAVIVALVWLSYFRDWRSAAVLSGLAAGWVPWVAMSLWGALTTRMEMVDGKPVPVARFEWLDAQPLRTVFTFYAIVLLPWVVLTLAYAIGLIIGPKDELSPRARKITMRSVGAVVTLVVLVGAFFYPVWTAWTIPHSHWQARMWLRTWI